MLQHQQLDRFTKDWLSDHRDSGKSIYCRAGCSGCCTLAVHASFPEAVNAAQNLTRQQKDDLDSYINRLLQIIPEAATVKDYLKRHRSEVGACPFLDQEGCCSIYSFRPLSCRALLSTRPADWCVVDFSELDHWDKQAYESGLDRDVVAWPTHYVAATQEYAASLEDRLLAEMARQRGWTLSGNFAVMVWLELNSHLSLSSCTLEEVETLLKEHGLDNKLLLSLY